MVISLFFNKGVLDKDDHNGDVNDDNDVDLMMMMMMMMMIIRAVMM